MAWKPDKRRGEAAQKESFKAYLQAIRGKADNKETKYLVDFPMAPLRDSRSSRAQVAKYGSAVVTRSVAELCCPDFNAAEYKDMVAAGLCTKGKAVIPIAKSKKKKELVVIGGILTLMATRIATSYEMVSRMFILEKGYEDFYEIWTSDGMSRGGRVSYIKRAKGEAAAECAALFGGGGTRRAPPRFNPWPPCAWQRRHSFTNCHGPGQPRCLRTRLITILRLQAVKSCHITPRGRRIVPRPCGAAGSPWS